MCQTKYCRRESKGKYCYRCEHAHKKERNPYRYWYGVNKRNANRRALKNGNGKFWYITFEHYVWFCDTYGYLAIKGRRKNDASIDCIKNELGYVDGNIQPLTVGENSQKGTKTPQFNPVTRSWDIVEFRQTEPESNLPF